MEGLETAVIIALITGILGFLGTVANLIYQYQKDSSETKLEEKRLNHEMQKFEQEDERKDLQVDISSNQIRMEVEQRVWERIKAELEDAYQRIDGVSLQLVEVKARLEEEERLRKRAEFQIEVLQNQLNVARSSISSFKEQVDSLSGRLHEEHTLRLTAEAELESLEIRFQAEKEDRRKSEADLNRRIEELQKQKEELLERVNRNGL